MEFKFSEPQLNQDTYVPYIEIECKTRLTLDPEAYISLRMANETMLNVLTQHFKDSLEAPLREELKKYKIEDGNGVGTSQKDVG